MWRLIESAPLDGTDILVYVPAKPWASILDPSVGGVKPAHQEVVYWRNGEWWTHGEEYAVTHAIHWKPLDPPP